MVFICFQTTNQYSQAFLLFDLPNQVSDILKTSISSKTEIPQIFTSCNLKRRPQMRSHVCDPSAPGVHSRYWPSPLSRAVAGKRVERPIHNVIYLHISLYISMYPHIILYTHVSNMKNRKEHAEFYGI